MVYSLPCPIYLHRLDAGISKVTEQNKYSNVVQPQKIDVDLQTGVFQHSLLDRDDILLRSYSVRRTGLTSVQILVLPGYFCLAHARNGKSHRHFKLLRNISQIWRWIGVCHGFYRWRYKNLDTKKIEKKTLVSQEMIWKVTKLYNWNFHLAIKKLHFNLEIGTPLQNLAPNSVAEKILKWRWDFSFLACARQKYPSNTEICTVDN